MNGNVNDHRMVPGKDISNEEIARLFHEAYERLAPSFGYSTRPETRSFDAESPNGRLMIAVAGEVKSALAVNSLVDVTEQMMAVERLCKAADSMMDKLEVIEQATVGVFTLAQIHGSVYKGPTYEKEFKELNDAVFQFRVKYEPVEPISRWASTQTIREVDCSRCGQPAGKDCRQPKGRIAPYPHPEREKAYIDKIGKEEWERRHMTIGKSFEEYMNEWRTK